MSNIIDVIRSELRRAQGERPGMSMGETYDLMGATKLLISTQVLITDVSYYQADIDFVKMKAAGAMGTIIRAGQRNWVDTKFKENWKKAKAAGLPRGSYWLVDSRETPEKQAALWWSLVKDDPAELVYVADLEENYGGPYGKQEHFQKFIEEFQRLSGLPDIKIVIYTGYYWWIARVGNKLFFKRYRLWLAWYSAMGNVETPEPWIDLELILWQFSSHGDGPKYGVGSGNIDLSWYCCSVSHYKKTFDLVDNGDHMRIIRGNVISQIYIRKGHGSEFAIADGLFVGDKIEANENYVFKWLHLTKITRVNGEVVLPGPDWWASAGDFEQYIAWDWFDVIDPPPPPAENEYILHVLDGVSRKFVIDPLS